MMRRLLERMPKMKILRYGNPALTTPCEIVSEWTKELHKTVQGMSFLIDQDIHAAALAANQVGCNYQFFIYKNQEFGHCVIINPEIVYAENPKIDIEGCLSFPNTFSLIQRYHLVEVEYTEFPSLNRIKKVFTGFEARVFQHEIEHLSGQLMLDNLSEAEKINFIARYHEANKSRR
jgi:peptide deformylase